MIPPDDDPQHFRFLRLYAEHEPTLRMFVRSMLPTREATAEVMQEVAVVLWQKFEAVEEFRPWAFGLARNVALRHLQSLARDRHVFDDALANQLADRAAAVEQRHDAQREALEHCLQKLPAPQRDLVLEAYTNGTRMDALAAQRGQTAMSLYKMLHRIRQALLECVRRALTQQEPT